MNHDQNGVHVEEVHSPGALIRIKMKNFVTYALAEFKCGPSLNMVLGPNGTGKSSLVCAICLGLGWGPAQLGRAKDIGEFVKNGFKEAEIEIELKAGAKHRGRNPIVTRIIKREGNKSTWFLNGASCSHKEIQNLMRYFGIQVDNLCQFLPQDKVADFAGLSPVELLQQTQKAVGTAEMAEWHEELKKLGNDRKKHINEQGQIDKTLSDLQNRQNQQKAEVDRLNERKDIQSKLKALQGHKIALHYQAEKDSYDTARTRRTAARAELEQLESEVEPVLQGANRKEQYYNQIQTVSDQRKQLVERSRRQADASLAKIESHKRLIEECNQQIKNFQNSKAKKNAEIITSKHTMASLEGRLKHEPPPFDAREYNERKRQKEQEVRELRNRVSVIEQSIRPKIEEYRSIQSNMKNLQESIDDLKTASGQQTVKLEQASSETAKAWLWIQKNADKFEKEIFGPPIVTCTANDTKLAPMLETLLQRNDFNAFTVQNERDMRTLQDYLFKHFKFTDISIRSINQPLSFFNAPFDEPTLKKHGFDGWLLDVLEGPEPVLAMLCEACKLHKIPYTMSAGDNMNIEKSPVDAFFTKEKFYSITRRREYGAGAVSTSVRTINGRGYWSDGGQTASREAELQDQYRAADRKLSELKGELQMLRDDKKQLEDQTEPINQEIADIDKEKSTLQKEHGEWRMIPGRLETERDKVTAAQELQAEYEQEILKNIRNKENLSLQRGQFAIDFSIGLNNVRKAVNEQFEAELLLAEAQSDLRNLHQRNKDIRATLVERRREVSDLVTEVDRLKKICVDLRRKFLESDGNCSEEEKQVRDDFDMRCRDEGITSGEARMQELEAEVGTLIQRLELVNPGNPHVMQEYEKRAQEIERISQRVGEIGGVIEGFDNQIEEIRSKWEPELDALVEEISTSFSNHFKQIACAGEVTVGKDEDFSEWSIKILVKFRENEQMSVLNSQRQSGGERAVSTVFYLMALQSKAKSPFRVVDEINQGMDPRNERMVHKRMVDIACKENTSQYFLITPKLLSGLDYHRRMSVHTIFSGEAMPQYDSTMDFTKFADIALRLAGKVN